MISDEKKRFTALEELQSQLVFEGYKPLDDHLFNTITDNALNDDNVEIRQKATELLGSLLLNGDKRAVEPLIKAYNDPRREVRCAALRDMYLNKDSRLVETFIRALKDRSQEVRLHALYSLSVKGECDLGDRLMDSLLEMLNSTRGDIRHQALMALRFSHSKRVLNPIIKFLGKNKHLLERYCAISVIGTIKAPLALNTLIGLLDTERSLKCKIKAVEELGNLGFKEAIEQLSRMANDDELDDALRDAALVSLIKLGKEEVITKLEEEYKDCDYERRAKIIRIAARAGTKSCRNILRKGLRHHSLNVALDAAHALAKIKDKKAIDILVHALEPKEPLQCADAVVSLGKLGDKKAVEQIIKVYSGYEALVIEALENIGGRKAVDFLIRQFQNEKCAVYLKDIVQALKRTGDKKAIKAINRSEKNKVYSKLQIN